MIIINYLTEIIKMDSQRLTDIISEKDGEYSQHYLDGFTPEERERRIESIAEDIKYCSKCYKFVFVYRQRSGKKGEFILPKEFDEEDRGLCATYRVIAKNISDKKTQYQVGTFELRDDKIVLVAPAIKINLEEKVK